ncbi:MAG TPA: PAS domain S-box protein [archaeon]|nr:PAS domain S-box protein [archaeon]
MESKIRNSGIDIIGKTPWGTHFCLFYQTKEDLIDILVPYFKAGLESNEYCMWVTSEPLNEKEAEEAIRGAMPNFDEYFKKKQIEIVHYTEWYLRDGVFDLDRVLNGWVEKIESAIENGFEGLRVTGNTAWLEDKDWKDFRDYEEEINNVIGNFQMMAICTYSLEKCGSFELLDVIQNHQFALIRREGKWESFKNMEQIALERKLKETELRYRTTFEQSPDGIIILDLETTRAVEFNIAICDILGYSREEFAELKVTDYDVIEDPSDTRAHVQKVLQQGRDDFETKLRTKNGDIKDIHVIAKVIELSGKKYFQSIWRDITERKKTERKLKESEEKFKALFENTNDAIFIHDRGSQFIEVNQTACEKLGYTRKKLLKLAPKDIIPPGFKIDLQANIKALQEKGELMIEAEHITKDGIIIPVEINSRIFNFGGKQTIISVVRDITERKVVEQELKESEEKWRALSENSPAHIMLCDREHKILFINRTVPDLSKEEVIGTPAYNYIPQKNRQLAIDYRDSVWETGEPITYTTKYITKKGDTRYFDVWHSPVFQNGKITALVSQHIDITERKKAERNLKESEEKYSTLAKLSPVGIFHTDQKGDCLYVNECWSQISGLTLDEALGAGWIKGLHRNDKKRVSAEWYNAAENNIPFESEYRFKRLDGKITWVYGQAIAVKNDLGKITGYIGTITDISERIQAEQKLKESKHNLGERVKELTCLYRLSRLMEEPNISFKNLIYGILDLIPPAWQFPDITIARITYDGREYELGNFEETEWKLSTKVKIIEKPLSIEVYYLEDKSFLKEEHDLIRDIGVRLKVTLEKKETQKRLRESEEKYRMGFKSSTDGIASADMEGTFIDCNNAFLEMLGYTRDELFKLNFRDITPQRWHEMEDNMIISQLTDGKDSGIYEKEYIRKDGTNFPVNARFWIIKDDQGDPVRMWTIVRDITERKKAEEKITDLAKFPSENPHPVLRLNRNRVIYVNNSGNYLLDVEEDDEIPEIFRKEVERAFETNFIVDVDIELKDRVYSFTITPFVEQNYVNLYGMDITESKLAELKLIEINKLKSEFLRRASHELKTPLISIKGYSDLILALHKDQISSEIISKLNEINRGCERLQNIINNLLETSRLESPELKPEVQKEDLSFLIKFCVHELQSLTQARNQTLDLNIQDGQYGIFEKEEIHDVISNLLTNAIKYTPPYGKISINTEEKGDFIMISVKDNGIGFTEEQEGRIFKQFGKIERYGQGLDLGIDGTGLGLYISKKIVESHGGEIWMESEGKSKGTTFYFTIPSIK